ncbi:MAG: enoyl-CoA hydratase/isomerase family protein [Armatimonadetes bacterium]|nr:enoyl-CoA hydratase/isomerase family protein [Armatimonadota bacterium]
MSYDSWMNAHRVAVMGAGTMGSGIAAHLANLGFDVTLFDLARETAQAGLDRAGQNRPPHFYGQDAVHRVRVASLADDLIALRDADWVCEAIIEKMDAKRALYEAIEPVLRDDAMISTNTSGLEIRLLGDGRSKLFRDRFIGTHFFNPPRYLKLIELIPTEETDPGAISAMTAFLEDRVGRRVVLAKDTPGFIANRYGMWALYQAIHTAEKLKFSVETVDTLTGPFIGRPRTATFRLADLIGLDIMADVAGNLVLRCGNDPLRSNLNMPASIANLIELGWIGSKAGQGYYKKEGDQFLSLDFRTKAYRPRVDADIPFLASVARLPIGERIRQTLEQRGEAGEFLREHLVPALLYAAEIGPEISYSVKDFDEVMKWGWGWAMGPFELIDEIGYGTLKNYSTSTPLAEKSPFYKKGAPLDLQTLTHSEHRHESRYATVSDFPIIKENTSWAKRDDLAGGTIFEFRSKMNALNPEIVVALLGHLEANPESRITLANEGPAYSVGFDLAYLLKLAEEGQFDEVQAALRLLQKCGLALRRARSAAALHGFALGGGLELAMHCRAVVAHPETTVGLPEALVGLIPAGGGTALMRMRTQHDIHFLSSAAISLASGRKVPAPEGHKYHFMRERDELAVNPDQVTSRALTAGRPEEKSTAWLPAPAPLAGMIDSEIDKLRAGGVIGEYGETIAGEIKRIFVKARSEESALEMEVESFLNLLGKPRTQLRIRHMLEKGNPLNN